MAMGSIPAVDDCGIAVTQVDLITDKVVNRGRERASKIESSGRGSMYQTELSRQVSEMGEQSALDQGEDTASLAGQKTKVKD